MQNKLRIQFFSSQHGVSHAFDKLIKGLSTNPAIETAIAHLAPLTALGFSQWSHQNTKKFDLVVTGTSIAPDINEQPIWSWAKTNGIPVFAYHDQWVNTEARFNVNANASLPDAIFVVDEVAKKLVQNLQLNLPIYVIGSPLWDDQEQTLKDRKAIPELVIFASEPAALKSFKNQAGFDDLDSLDLALQAFEALPKDAGIKFEILLHPTDKPKRIEDFLKMRSSHLQPVISSLTKQQTFLSANYVLGMRSMLLVEASLLGIPVISFQPHRKTLSPATDRDGIQVVTQINEAADAITNAKLNFPRLNRTSSVVLFKKALEDYLKIDPI